MIEFIKSKIETSVDLKSSLLKNTVLLNTVDSIVREITGSYKNGGKVRKRWKCS